MIRYECIVLLVRAVPLSAMRQLTVEPDGCAMRPVSYCGAKEEEGGSQQRGTKSIASTQEHREREREECE